MQNEFLVLKALNRVLNLEVNQPTPVSFKRLRSITGLSNDELDSALISLDREQFIAEFVPGRDVFHVMLQEKGSMSASQN